MKQVRSHRHAATDGWRAWSIWLVVAAGVAFSLFLTWAISPSNGLHTDDELVSWVTLLLGLLGTGIAVGLLASWRMAGARAGDLAEALVADLRATEEELRSSEARWRFAIDGAGDGLWDWDVTAGTVWFSHRWKSMLGFADHEVGTSLDEWSSRVHPDDLDAVMACVDAYLRNETDHYECIHRVQRKDGSYVWVLDRGLAVERDDAGNPTRIIGTHKDVSVQQRLEADLRSRTADLEQAQRLAKMGSWTLDVDTGAVEWSPPLFDMFAIPAATSAPDFTRQHELFTPKSWDELNTAVRECVEHSTAYDLELEGITCTGVHRALLARGYAVTDDVGRVVQVRGIAMDITDRQWAVGRIAHLTALYKALSECNAAQVHAADEADLYRRVCDVMVRHNGVQMAWLGLLDPSSGHIVPTASAGEGLHYLDGIDIRVAADDPRGRGPAGTAAREQRPVWVDDFGHDPRMHPWRQLGMAYGWAAVGSLPILHHGETVAVLNLYFTDRDFLDGETRSLLSAMADDISYSVERLRTAAQLEESEQRFRSLVEQSIAGAYIVQEDKFAYVNPRFKEILGYAPDDDLTGIPVQELLPNDEAASSTQRGRRLQSGATAQLEATLRVRCKDGSYVSVGTHSSIATYHRRPAVIGLMQDLSDRRVAEAEIERYVEQLEKVMFQTVGVITELSSMRDPYTSNHERNVATLAVEIGRRMGLDDDRLEGIRVGGLVHDIGKIAVPTEILVKPTRLTSLEFAMVREHPRIGFELLSGIDFPWPVARVAHEHHERIDGTGYPRGLVGEQICLEARIVTVADVVDSMSSHRPYRASLGTSAALDEIERHAGTWYDADVVVACAALIREGVYLPG